LTAESAGRWSGWRPWAIGAAVLALGALVFDALRGLLREVRYADVVQQIATQPATDLLWAGVATAISYLVLTGYDFSALRYAGAKVRRSIILLTSFIACACTRPQASRPDALHRLPPSMPARSSSA
jgi:phosphatidylglycerol lysyltransferase